MTAPAKRLVLHLGMPKTGTTSIQNVLRRRSERLKTFGILYPGPDEDPRLDIAINHTAYFSALTGRLIPNSGMKTIEECKEALSKVVDLFERHEKFSTLVISHESLATNIERLDADFIRDWQDKFATTVIVYVRPMREWVESRYIQAIFARAMGQADKNVGSDPRSILKGIMKRIDTALPSSILEKCRCVFPAGDIEFRSFIERRENNDLVEHFIESTFSQISLQKNPINVRLKTKNASRPPIFVAFMYRLLHAGISVESAREIVKRFTFITREEGLEPPFGKKAFMFISDEEFDALAKLDEQEAEKFPELRLDAPVKRSRDAPSAMTDEEFDTFVDWLSPHIAPEAAQEARNVRNSS